MYLIMQVSQSLFLSTALNLMVMLGGLCAPGSSTVSEESLIKAVQNCPNLPAEYRQQVYADYAGENVAISLFRPEEASPEDCKIDAILLSRRLMTCFPGKLKTIRVAFYDQDRHNEFWDVQVRSSLITAYASGHLSQNELLNSVSFKEDSQKNPLSSKYASMAYKSIIEDTEVTTGIFQERRLALALRLRTLTRQGVNTGTFQEEFLKIEDAARRGKATNLSTQIDKLNEILNRESKASKPSGKLSLSESGFEQLNRLQTDTNTGTTNGIK